MKRPNKMRLLGVLLAWLTALVFWFALFWATAALAQPNISRGGALKKRQYQTYSAITLYVDPTGSDSNACTSTGTAACLTLDGALGKLPRHLNHTVTINVAAGSYAAPTLLAGFSASASGSLNITGEMAAVTPATGTSSGTFTSTSTGNASAFSTATDSGQTWTVNDLRGKFLTLTGSGVSYPIVSNTATTITVPAVVSLGSAGTAYSITEPSAVITGATTVQPLSGPTTTLQFTRIRWNLTSGAVLTYANSLTALGLLECSLTTASGNGILTSSRLTLVRTYVRATSTGILFTTGSGASRAYSLTSTFVWSNGSAITMREGQMTTVNSVAARSENGSTTVVDVSGGPGGSFLPADVTSALVLECASATSTVGFDVGTGPAVSTQLSGPATGRANMRITGCATGLRVSNGAWFRMPTSGTLSITSATTGIQLLTGGRVNLGGGTPTFNTVTNELELDGSTYTFANLTGLPSPQVISNSYGTVIMR